MMTELVGVLEQACHNLTLAVAGRGTGNNASSSLHKPSADLF